MQLTAAHLGRRHAISSSAARQARSIARPARSRAGQSRPDDQLLRSGRAASSSRRRPGCQSRFAAAAAAAGDSGGSAADAGAGGPLEQPPAAGGREQASGPGDEAALLAQRVAKLRALADYEALLAAHPPRPDEAGEPSSLRAARARAAKRQPRQQAAQAQAAQAQPGGEQAQGAGEVPVLQAAILIARHAYPQLDEAAIHRQLDELAAEVEAGLPPGTRYPLRVIKQINKVLFEVHGFAGNEQDYYSPDNSCINRVLDSKRGIPISLCVVYMEVAARVGLRMGGVNLPAHFMIRPQVEGLEWLVDPFNGGELTALQDAEAMLSRLTGLQVVLDPKWVSAPPLSSRALLLRLLNNLRQVYVTLNLSEQALAIIKYMQLTAPWPLPELARDEGLCLFAMGRLAEAGEVLAAYLAEGGPEPRDAAVVEAILGRIREQQAAARAEEAEAAARAAAAAAAAAATQPGGEAQPGLGLGGGGATSSGSEE